MRAGGRREGVRITRRNRVSEVHGVPRGLDAGDLARAFAAGNAVVPAIAEWIARLLLRS
jgi:DNA (cytosine-5)-methyltransferase 1